MEKLDTFITFIHLIGNLHINQHSCLPMRREGTTPWDIPQLFHNYNINFNFYFHSGVEKVV